MPLGPSAMKISTHLPSARIGSNVGAVPRVVEADHRRPVAADHDLPQVRKPSPCFVGVAQEPVVLREVWEELDRDFSDEAERALVADHDVADVGSGRPPGHVLDAGAAVGKHRLQAHDHVLDAAVEGRELADAARRHPTAHVGERLGLRRVAGRETQLASGIFQRLQGHPTLAGCWHVVGVDLDDAVHRRTIQHDRSRARGSPDRLRSRSGPCGARR